MLCGWRDRHGVESPSEGVYACDEIVDGVLKFFDLRVVIVFHGRDCVVSTNLWQVGLLFFWIWA